MLPASTLCFGRFVVRNTGGSVHLCSMPFTFLLLMFSYTSVNLWSGKHSAATGKSHETVHLTGSASTLRQGCQLQRQHVNRSSRATLHVTARIICWNLKEFTSFTYWTLIMKNILLSHLPFCLAGQLHLLFDVDASVNGLQHVTLKVNFTCKTVE